MRVGEFPFGARSCYWVSDFQLGSSLLVAVYLASLPVGFLMICLSFSLPVEGHFS